MLAVIAFILYAVVRLAVLHALRAHSEWLRGQVPGESGSPAS
ncbi:hypothetical protein [Microbacterium sp.]|nr:hypothetical protein [Microbacterium sp.]